MGLRYTRHRGAGRFLIPFILLLLIFLSTPTQAQKLDASYKGEDLFLVEAAPFSSEDYRYVEANGYDLTRPLYSIYWNPKNNQYYYAKAGSLLTKTNGLTYKLDPAKTNATLVYHPKVVYWKLVNSRFTIFNNRAEIKSGFARNLQPGLAFAGWISPNQRLFVHIPTQQQYLQTLSPIEDIAAFVPHLSMSRTGFNGLDTTYGIANKPLYESYHRLSDGNLHIADDGC